MYNETITYYSRNPFNKSKLDDYDIKHFEENVVCWDDITIFLKIENNKIKNWSFIWDTSIITTACASIFWESIIDMDLKDILEKDYEYIVELIEDRVSEKREKAAVLWLLTTRNAIHKYLNDWKVDGFDDLIKN